MQLFIALFLACYPALVGLIAVPIALGAADWWVRLGALYVLSLMLGFVLMIVLLGDGFAELLVFALLFVGGGWSRAAAWWHVVLVGVGLLMLAVLLLNLPWNQLQIAWLLRGTIGVAIIASACLLFRVLGFRLILVGVALDEAELVAGTGRSWDEWIGVLDRSTEPCDTPEHVHAEIRSYGLTSEWTREVERVYLQMSGRIPHSRTFDGRSLFIARRVNHGAAGVDGGRNMARGGATGGPLRWIGEAVTAWRFSLWQMLTWSVAAASMLAFVRLFETDFPTSNDLVYGPGAVGTLCVISLATAVASLGVPPRRWTLVPAFLVIGGAVMVTPLVLSLSGLKWGPLHLLGVMALGVAVLQCFGFLLFRQFGYRIIRLSPRAGFGDSHRDRAGFRPGVGKHVNSGTSEALG